MKNYLYTLLLFCSVMAIAQENTIKQAVCYQPRIDATNFNHSNMVINYGRYYATGDITSTNTILNSEYSNNSPTYFADNSIILGDGFRATSEADGGIKIAIENCSVCKCVTDFTVHDNQKRRDRTFKIEYNPTACETENITFDWYFSDGMVVMNGGDVVKREYDWPTAYTSARVVATMPNGCQSEISSVETGGIKPAPITIYPNPSPDIFNVNGGFLVGTTATVIDRFNGQVLFEKTATIDNEIQIDLTNYPAGIYILKIYDSDIDYHFTDEIIKEEPIIEEKPIYYDPVSTHVFTVYPNPSTGVFTIIDSSITKGMRIIVTDYASQQIMETNATIDGEVQINLTGYTPGIYFVSLFMEDGSVFTDELVKE